MTIKASRRTWDPQGRWLSLYSQGSHPDPPVSSASAPAALLNREIRDGEDSPTAAQILRLTQNPRRKTTSEMACPDGPHGLCTLMQGTWSVMRRPSDFHHKPLRLCLSGLTKTQEAEECGAHGSASVRQEAELSKADRVTGCGRRAVLVYSAWFMSHGKMASLFSHQGWKSDLSRITEHTS